MSKHWKPARPTVALGKSRIRRDPVPVEQPKPVRVYSPELEMWGGVTGIVLFATIIAVLVIGAGILTFSRYDPAAEAEVFGQCYNGGPNCVVDGDTVIVRGSTMQIAGIVAPKIQGAACEDERSRGITAAMRLAELLNGGKVTAGPAFRDYWGRSVRKVEVDGKDVGAAMLSAELVRAPNGDEPDWCG